MSKKFVYTDVNERVYLEGTDEYEDFGEEFEYEVEDEELLKKIINIVYRDYFYYPGIEDHPDYISAVKHGLKDFIRDNDNLDELVDDYENELRDLFMDEAFESYKNY